MNPTRRIMIVLRTLLTKGPYFLRCPEHGGWCDGRSTCCCADCHWRPWRSYYTNPRRSA